MVQNLYSDKYCVILRFFHDCLRNSGNMIRFTSFAGSLHVITVAQAEQFSLVPGKKLCPQCCISLYKNKEENYEPMGSVYQDDETMKDQLNTSLTSLGCSPIKFVASNKRLTYGKRKLQEVNKTTEGYMANLLNIDQDLLNEKPEHCCQDTTDLLHMMESIKEKIHAKNDHQEKIKLLTLAPKSWTIEKTAEYFYVSIRSVKSTKELRKSSGILSNKSKRKGKVLDEDVQKNFISCYGSDEFSRMCPGKKEYVSVKVKGRREHIQKRLLLVNLKELHIDTIKELGYQSFVNWGQNGVFWWVELLVFILYVFVNIIKISSCLLQKFPDSPTTKICLKELSAIPTSGTVCLEVATNFLQWIVLELIY